MTKVLDGIRVLGLEQFVAGPHCSMILADAGAEVIKVEHPSGGDPARSIPHFATDSDGSVYSGVLLRHNRNKLSLTLDLQNEKGKEVFKDLVRVSDVIVENFAPETIENMGLGYDVLKEVNPRIIYASISGFGRLKDYRGPYWKRGAFDPVLQAMGGLMFLQKDEEGRPAHVGIPISDLYPALVAAFGIILTLYARQKTGRGGFVDISMYDTMIALCESPIMLYSMTGVVQKPGGGVNPFLGPTGPYKCKDGFVAFVLPTNEVWARFCKAMGNEGLINHPMAANQPDRINHYSDFLKPLIEDWMKDKTKEEVVMIFEEARVPIGPVQSTEDIFKCPQIEARKMLVDLESPLGLKVKVPSSPVKLDTMSELKPRFPPRLGEHTEEVLSKALGYSKEKIDSLRKEEVI